MFLVELFKEQKKFLKDVMLRNPLFNLWNIMLAYYNLLHSKQKFHHSSRLFSLIFPLGRILFVAYRWRTIACKDSIDNVHEISPEVVVLKFIIYIPDLNETWSRIWSKLIIPFLMLTIYYLFIANNKIIFLYQNRAHFMFHVQVKLGQVWKSPVVV